MADQRERRDVVIKLRIPLDDGIYHTAYVKSYDPDAGTDIVTGDLEFTGNIHEAKRFPSVVEAFEEWNRQSKRVPHRPDGKPNRPMTKFNMSVEPAPEEPSPR